MKVAKKVNRENDLLKYGIIVHFIKDKNDFNTECGVSRKENSYINLKIKSILYLLILKVFNMLMITKRVSMTKLLVLILLIMNLMLDQRFLDQVLDYCVRKSKNLIVLELPIMRVKTLRLLQMAYVLWMRLLNF